MNKITFKFPILMFTVYYLWLQQFHAGHYDISIEDIANLHVITVILCINIRNQFSVLYLHLTLNPSNSKKLISKGKYTIKYWSVSYIIQKNVTINWNLCDRVVGTGQGNSSGTESVVCSTNGVRKCWRRGYKI